jgi:threonine/homoserine/homoserine lactone efflux protein
MNGANFPLFLAAALVIAAVPGPGIFYVAARTLSGGRKAGIASTLGTALGGLVHVVAGALGVSAIILASAELFTALKFAGALYLVWLGIRTFREADKQCRRISPAGAGGPFRRRHGRNLESKTAVFFRRSFRNLSADRWPRCPPVHGARPDLLIALNALAGSW